MVGVLESFRLILRGAWRILAPVASRFANTLQIFICLMSDFRKRLILFYDTQVQKLTRIILIDNNIFLKLNPTNVEITPPLDYSSITCPPRHRAPVISRVPL